MENEDRTFRLYNFYLQKGVEPSVAASLVRSAILNEVNIHIQMFVDDFGEAFGVGDQDRQRNGPYLRQLPESIITAFGAMDGAPAFLEAIAMVLDKDGKLRND